MVRWRHEALNKLLTARGLSWYQFGKRLGFKRVERVYKVFRKDGLFRRLDERVLSKVCELLDTSPGTVLEYLPDDAATRRALSAKR